MPVKALRAVETDCRTFSGSSGMNSISSDTWSPTLTLKLPSVASNLRIWTSFDPPPPCVSTRTDADPSRWSATLPWTNFWTIESRLPPSRSVTLWVMNPSDVPTMSLAVKAGESRYTEATGAPAELSENSRKNVWRTRVTVTGLLDTALTAAAMSSRSWSSSWSRLSEPGSGPSTAPSPRMSKLIGTVVHEPRVASVLLSLNVPSVA